MCIEHMHTHIQPFNGLWSLTQGAGTRRNIHPLTPLLLIRHPLSTSSIYYDPLCSVYVLDSPFPQPLSRSYLVFLLVLDPLLHTPCISSPNHHLFAAHAHTIAACSVVIPIVCHLYLISLSLSLSLSSWLGNLSFSLMPHIHLTILIPARWSATSFSFLTGQGPDLQNILRQSYDYLTIIPKLRWTYDGRLIYKTSYEERKAFLSYDSLADL